MAELLDQTRGRWEQREHLSIAHARHTSALIDVSAESTRLEKELLRVRRFWRYGRLRSPLGLGRASMAHGRRTPKS